MANLAVSNTLVALSQITVAPLNTNFSDIVTYINARNGGSTAWDALSVTGTSTLTGAVTLSSTLGVTGALTATGGIVSLFGYRRPNLVFASTTAVDVENNTGTSNQTRIIFPDGTIRSVTEDTSSTHKYRRFLITATAEFTTGTEDSGLISGLSEATNTWYAIYAVKSAINSANFVLVGTTTLPLQSNFATLNTDFGTNGWVYLGMIRNGDNAGATGDILDFDQSGSITSFQNTVSTNSQSFCGMLLASNASTTALTYTYAAGTAAAEIPHHIKLGLATVYAATSSMDIADSADSRKYAAIVGTGASSGVLLSLLGGIKNYSGNAGARSTVLTMFIDPLLDGTHQVI